MRDYFSEHYEWDERGMPRRKKRVLPDGGHGHVPTMMRMDHAAFGFRTHFSDGSVDPTNPHQPGFRFGDVGAPVKLQADQAYEERRHMMDYRHRRQPSAQPQDARQMTLDELEAAATAAYKARSERMRTAWKTRHA